MTPKTLEEFIEDHVGNTALENAMTPALMRAVMQTTAAEILRVVEEYVNKGIGSGDFGAKDMVVTMHHQGDSATARMLYDFLKSYIQPVKKESDEQKV